MSSEAPAPEARARKRGWPKSPPLLRTSNWLHRVAAIVTVVLLVYVGSIAYSAAHVSVQTPNGGFGSLGGQSLGPNRVSYSTEINLTNGGFYSITGFSVSVVSYLAGGPVVGGYAGQSTTIGAGARMQIPLQVDVNVAPGYPGQMLLTQNATLEIEGWVNATLGYLVSASVGFTGGNGTSWHAPFADYRVGATIAGLLADATLEFTNGLDLTLAGTLTLTLVDASDAACGSGTMAVNVPGSHSFSGSTEIALSAGCTPAFAESTLSGPGYALTLPVVVLT
ncbi:MAG: hypothetical protein ACREBT_00055 [Thermoplasmata archaeon]